VILTSERARIPEAWLVNVHRSSGDRGIIHETRS
jgi:hypothetical protein